MDPLINTSTAVSPVSVFPLCIQACSLVCPLWKHVAVGSWGYSISSFGYSPSYPTPSALYHGYSALVSEFFTFPCKACTFLYNLCIGTFVPAAQPSQAVPVVSGFSSPDQTIGLLFSLFWLIFSIPSAMSRECTGYCQFYC